MQKEQWMRLNNLQQQGGGGLLEGDIMMKQLYHIELAGTVITAGQKIAKGLRWATMQGFTADTKNEHAGMMIDGENMVEAIGKGVTMGVINKGDHLKTPYVVFRCSDRQLAADAGKIGKAFMGYGSLFNPDRSGASGNSKIDPGKYSATGGTAAIFQPFGKTKRGASITLIDKMRDFISGKSNIRPNMYCTQFVAACYVLAADWGAHPQRNLDPGLNVNPGSMIPIVYAKCLSRSSIFTIAGRYGQFGQ